MKYKVVDIKLSKLDPYRDMLVYGLGEEGPYDSFEETRDGIKAYVPAQSYDASFVEQQLASLRELDGAIQCSFVCNDMEDKDYNEEWERDYQPVLVDGFCWVRAPFHEHRDDVRYEIEIEPKMSFGTAHHSTTYLMLSMMEAVDLSAKRVLDMGSGTGVLAILAAKKGAAYVEAIDVDEWAYKNAVENFSRNAVAINALLGDASLLTADKHFDLVLANINRNILLRDMEAYVSVMNPGAMILFSGFFESDVDAIAQEANRLGLTLAEKRIRNDWAALRFCR